MHRTGLRQRLRLSLFIAVGLALTGVALVAYGTNVFSQQELTSLDWRFSIRGTQPVPKNVVVVAIDDTTFSDFNTQQLHVRWPFPRSMFGRVITRLSKDGAKVIAYDIQFTEQTTPAQDNALIEAVANARNVVLATTEVDSAGHTNVFGGDSVVRSVHARVGNSNYVTDSTGVIRQVAYKIDKLKSFPLVAAERAEGTTITPSDFGHRKLNWIDFAGAPGTFPTYSFSRV